MKSDIYYIFVYLIYIELCIVGCSVECCVVVYIFLDGFFLYVLILFFLDVKDKDKFNLYLYFNLDKSFVLRINIVIYLFLRVDKLL